MANALLFGTRWQPYADDLGSGESEMFVVTRLDRAKHLEAVKENRAMAHPFPNREISEMDAKTTGTI
jgi:hypothetical protein